MSHKRRLLTEEEKDQPSSEKVLQQFEKKFEDVENLRFFGFALHLVRRYLQQPEAAEQIKKLLFTLRDIYRLNIYKQCHLQTELLNDFCQLAIDKDMFERSTLREYIGNLVRRVLATRHRNLGREREFY